MIKKEVIFLILLFCILFISGCDSDTAGKKDLVSTKILKTSLNMPFSLNSNGQPILSNPDSSYLFSVNGDLISKSDVKKFFSSQETIEKIIVNSENPSSKVISKTLNIDFPSDLISAISISGTITIFDKSGWARVIMVDSNGQLWLVIGSDFLFHDYGNLDFKNFCDETCLLEEDIFIDHIFVELLNADINIGEIHFQKSFGKIEGKTSQKISSQKLRNKQYDVRLDLVTSFVENNDLSWVAGPTTVSRGYYRNLKRLQFETSILKIPYSFFFYKKGVYDIR